MGWLFGRKRAPRVMLPEGKQVEEGELRFPVSFAAERVIEPEEPAEEKRPVVPPFFRPRQEKMFQPQKNEPLWSPPRPIPSPHASAVFVRRDSYQLLLGSLEELKADMTHLNGAQRALESSEFNEEHHFERLKRSVKGVHDRILQMDKILFKS